MISYKSSLPVQIDQRFIIKSTDKNVDWLLTELYNKRKQTVRSINECTWLYEKFFLFVDGYLSSDGKNCMAMHIVEMFSSVSSETTIDKEPCVGKVIEQH